MAIGPTAREVVAAAGVDLHGKVALVTGAGSGIGTETARELARAGARVILAVRDPASQAATDLLADLRRSLAPNGGVAQLELVALDLADLASVRRCAAAVLSRHRELHLLVNNAGIMACPLARTADGYELQFATNHLGHFVLTNLLVPALKAGAPSRIVNVSSLAHSLAPVDFDDIHFERRRYGRWIAYAQSKTANVLFTVELDRRLSVLGITALSLHPGTIATNLVRHLASPPSEAEKAANAAARATEKPKPRRVTPQEEMKTVEQGAATTLFAAVHPSLAGRGGLYLQDCRIAPLFNEADPNQGVQPYALDPVAAARLWVASETMARQSFPLSRL